MISLNSNLIGGLVTGAVRRGHAPLTWMLVSVQTYADLWDRKGNMSKVSMVERVIVQGSANVHALYSRIVPGTEIIAQGQGVPAHCVAADSDLRGRVTLATTFQIITH